MSFFDRGSELCADIRVVLESQGARISINSGTVDADVKVPKPYQPGARIPKDDWAPLSLGLQATLAHLCPESYNHVFRVGDVPVPVLTDLRYRVQSRELNKAIPFALRQWFEQEFSVSSATLIPNGLAIQGNGFPTITFDQRTGLSIGLHLDSWDGLPLMDREHSTNRVCINLGEHSRYFYFYPYSVRRLRALLVSRFGLVEGSENASAVVRQFLNRYADEPLLRVILPAGSYYLAPTELIAHDGGMADGQMESITYTVRGYF